MPENVNPSEEQPQEESPQQEQSNENTILNKTFSFFDSLKDSFNSNKQSDEEKIEPVSQEEPTSQEESVLQEEISEQHSQEDTEGDLALQTARENQTTPTKYPPSPIKEQRRDYKIDNEETRNPVEIVILSGKYQGKKLNLSPADSSFLGTGINQVKQKQSAEWNKDDSDQIRSGANFKRISSRTFSLDLEFYDVRYDVSHLAEQLSILQEVDPDIGTPPLLHITQGDLYLVNSVCTDIDTTYDYPLPGRRGYHHAKVSISFELFGGKGSSHAYGPPLTSTPLGDALAQQTEKERTQEALSKKAELLLGECLGPKGQKELQKILEDGGKSMNNPNKILELPSDTRLQLAISGSFPDEVIQNENVQNALKNDLATAVAQSTRGVDYRSVDIQEALVQDDPSLLPSNLNSPQQWENIKSNFQLVWEDLKNNNLSPKTSDVMRGKTPKHARAFNQLSTYGSCGLSLLEAGGLGISSLPEEEQPELLKSINETIKQASDEDLKQIFNVDSQPLVDILRDGHPFVSTSDFIDSFNKPELGTNGYKVLSDFKDNFEQYSGDENENN